MYTLDEIIGDNSNPQQKDYKITKNCLILKMNGSTYRIDKSRCLTREKRWEWLAHMCEKNWIDNYGFMKMLLKACKYWNI